jgi:hypothetical protein
MLTLTKSLTDRTDGRKKRMPGSPTQIDIGLGETRPLHPSDPAAFNTAWLQTSLVTCSRRSKFTELELNLLI